MKLLNVYYGTDQYDFALEPHHYKSRCCASEEEISYSLDAANKDLVMGKCYWYLIIVIDINPHTGEMTTTHVFNGVPEKSKIILNAIAKQRELSNTAVLKATPMPKDLFAELFQV